MLEQHNNEVCEEHRKICPLPRIGSKGWGWECWCSSSDGDARYCPKIGIETKYEPRRDHREALPFLVWNEGTRVTEAIFRTLDDAFRFAELLARRDWRRENRLKK